MKKHFQVFKNFSKAGPHLRNEFDLYFSDPIKTHAKRFVWDQWYYEDHYHHLRTPAYHYFSKNYFDQFQSEIIQWGRENLGCHSISPPWLSYYIDGCYQNMHSDVPHGPWAFVYSLTLDPNLFKGGETFILKPDVLNYWQNFLTSGSGHRDFSSFVDRIPSNFNQLTVFDPRYPHGVTPVSGTHNPQKARLVIHGWFVEPRPYVVGGLKTSDVEKPLADALKSVSKAIQECGDFHGTLSFRLKVTSSGEVQEFKLMTNTLMNLVSHLNNNINDSQVNQILKKIKLIFINLKFKKTRFSSEITIPLLFK